MLITFPNDELLTLWHVIIDGPDGSPFVGGKFTVSIDFQDNYPFKCPNVKFLTKIYHPNVKTDTGEICDEMLKNVWVPTLDARYIISTLQDLIANPTTDSPLEAEIANQFQFNRAKFN